MGSLPDPKNSLPPVPWVDDKHIHGCPHCHSPWLDETKGCIEPYYVECPACFEWFADRAAELDKDRDRE